MFENKEQRNKIHHKESDGDALVVVLTGQHGLRFKFVHINGNTIEILFYWTITYLHF